MDELVVTGLQVCGLEVAPRIVQLLKKLFMGGQVMVPGKFVAQGADSQCRRTWIVGGEGCYDSVVERNVARVLEEIKLHCFRLGYCVSRTSTPTRGAHGFPGLLLEGHQGQHRRVVDVDVVGDRRGEQVLRVRGLEEPATRSMLTMSRWAKGSSMNTKPPGRDSSIISATSRISEFHHLLAAGGIAVVHAHEAFVVEIEAHRQRGLRQRQVVVGQQRQLGFAP